MKRSVFLFWLYSNLAILCVPILISMAVLFQSQQLLHSEVVRSNELMLSQVRQSLDNQFRDIKRMGLQLSLDPKVLKFAGEEHALADKLGILDMISLLRSYTMSNGNIDDLYIYVKKEDFGVSTSTMNESDLLYRLSHDSRQLTKAQWSAAVRSNHFGDFYKFSSDDLVYLQSVPLQNIKDYEADATLVVQLNSERIKTAIAGIRTSRSGSVLILDADRNVVMASGDGGDAAKIDTGKLGASRGSFTQRLDGTMVNVSYVSSVENDWTYVSVVPTKIYEAKTAELRNWIFAGLFLSVFVGAPISIWLARRNYRPIRNIVDMVSPKVKSNLLEIKNEFSLLQSFLNESDALQASANRTIELQQSALRKHFLARLLKGRVESGSALAQAIGSFDLQFASHSFAVVLFHIGDYAPLFRDSSRHRDAESKFQYVCYIVSNIAEELIRRKHDSYAAEVDGMLALLVNIRGDDAEAERELIDSVREAQRVIHDKFYIQLTVGVSAIHATMDAIPAGFEEALEALEYKFVLGQNQVITYDRIQQPKNELYYPLDTERQLINHIRTGQYEESRQTISQLIATNVAGGTLSLQLGKLLVFELIGTMLKAIEHLQHGADEIAAEKAALVKKLTQCQSLGEIQEEIYPFLNRVCAYVDSKKKSRNVTLKDDVQSFIDTHLSDADLSLTALSDHFDLNTQYLSRFIKEQFGETFIDYVNKQRVQLAKRLMEETGDTINDITQQVGFTNSNSFIRVFKRYEGITPGQFRKGSE